MPHRVGQEAAGEDVDRPVEGRREQHPLAFGRGGVKEPLNDGKEAEVGHVVRFVDHADLDVTQVTVALLDQVGQAPRAGDDDVGPAAQRGHLRMLGDAAEDGGDTEAHRARQWHENGLDLAGQLTGRHQHQPAWAACHSVPPASLAASGRENPSVLPDPVRPRPRMSRPSRASGSVAAWIGKGVVIPVLASTATSGGGTPRELNVVPDTGALSVRFRRWAA